MSAFEDASDALFTDSDLSEAARYREAGFGPGTALRIIRGAPEDVQVVFDARIVAPTIRVQIRIAELATRPAKGDTITVGTDTLTVRHAVRDAEGLAWEALCDG